MMNDVTYISRQRAERDMSHHVAHDLINHLGAVDVYLDMILEDIDDPILKTRLQKARGAVDAAKSQVDALRVIVPRGDGSLVGLTLQQLGAVLGYIVGSVANMIDYQVGANDAVRHVTGEVAALVDILFRAVNFYLGHDYLNSVVIKVACDSNLARIIVVPKNIDLGGLIIPDLDPDLPDVTVELQTVDRGGGFILHWPITAL